MIKPIDAQCSLFLKKCVAQMCKDLEPKGIIHFEKLCFNLNILNYNQPHLKGVKVKQYENYIKWMCN